MFWWDRPEDMRVYSGTLVFFFLVSEGMHHIRASFVDKDIEAEFRVRYTLCHLEFTLHVMVSTEYFRLQCQLISLTPIHFFFFLCGDPGLLRGQEDKIIYSLQPMVSSISEKERGQCPLSAPLDPTKSLSCSSHSSPFTSRWIAALKQSPKVRFTYGVRYTTYKVQG
jgi:hypothetical protein